MAGGGHPSRSLEGRTALVTGASRGIGAAIARTLVSHGARVALVGRNAARLEALTDELGPQGIPMMCDLEDRRSVETMTTKVAEAFGGTPEILVNNAGVFDLAPLHEIPESFFLTTLHTNLTAPFVLIRTFLAEMRARGSGDIVTIGSIADRNIMPENGAYAAAKYGLRALHEVLRLETSGTGVRASLVSPGAVDTELWDELLREPGNRMLPTREGMLSASAVADAVLYVISQPRSVNIDELRLSHS